MGRWNTCQWVGGQWVGSNNVGGSTIGGSVEELLVGRWSVIGGPSV